MYSCKYSNKVFGTATCGFFIEGTHISGYVDSYMYMYMKELH